MENVQIKQIKKIIMIGLGIVTFSWLMSVSFTSVMDNSEAVKERNRIEKEMKEKKQEINTLAIERDQINQELTAKEAELEAMRVQRQTATDQINNWINEGLGKSQ